MTESEDICVKKLISVCLCVLLCGTASAAAADAPEQAEPTRLTWEDLEERIRGGSLNALVLEENIGSIQAIDYKRMYEELREQINSVAKAPWMMILMGDPDGAEGLRPTANTLRDTFESIKDGTMQEDNADTIHQLDSAVSQITMAGETLYTNLLSMEQSARNAQRGLAALDRNLAELRLRQEFGQVSAQAVADLEQTRADTVSQLETLQHNVTTCKMQLQLLVGEEPIGELELGPLPEITTEEIAALDYEAGLTAAKEASWTLRSAELTLEDAREEWNDSQSGVRYKQEIAEHTWNAAQITCQSAVQDFETAFQTLYRSLSNLQQVWENKQAAVRYQEEQLEIAQAQYDWGRISHSALLTAQDNAETARSEAEIARIELFSALNQYRVAVETGVLNG